MLIWLATRNVSTDSISLGLGKQQIILGFPWLQEQNPEINWKTGIIEWQTEPEPEHEEQSMEMELWKPDTLPRTFPTLPFIEEIEDEEFEKNRTTNPIIMETPEYPIVDLKEETGKWTPETEPSIPIFSMDFYKDDGEEVEEIWIYAHRTLAMELAIQENLKKEELTNEQMVPSEFHEYLDVFSKTKAGRFPESKPWDHKVEMKEGFEPKSFKNYNLTPEEQIKLDKFLKDNLDKGYIRPLQSLMASPFFFVKKKDGKLHPCQDYQYLNECTIKNAYPLPLISDIMDRLKDATYFTKLDIQAGYNNVRIKEGDQWKGAFKTNQGLFKLTAMFFGMCNSPATFQSMMDEIFVDLVKDEQMIVYIDDLFFHAETKEKLAEITRSVLQQCRDNDLFLKAKKCEFYQMKTEYLPRGRETWLRISSYAST